MRDTGPGHLGVLVRYADDEGHARLQPLAILAMGLGQALDQVDGVAAASTVLERVERRNRAVGDDGIGEEQLGQLRGHLPQTGARRLQVQHHHPPQECLHVAMPEQVHRQDGRCALDQVVVHLRDPFQLDARAPLREQVHRAAAPGSVDQEDPLGVV